MGFLYPYNLLFLPLSLLPVIIHLIKQKRVREEPFPDIRLIERAKVDLRRRILLKELIKLLMRVLMIIFLVLTLSGLYIGKGRVDNIVVIVDNSPSMGLMVGKETLLDKAKDVALEIIRRVPSNTEISVHSLVGDTGFNYTSNKAKVENIIQNIQYGFNLPDIRFTLDNSLKMNDSKTRFVFITDGFDVLGMDDLNRYDASIDIIPITMNERVEKMRIEKRELLNNTPDTLISLSGLESHSKVDIEVVVGGEKRSERLESEDDNCDKWVRTDFNAGYIHLLGSTNTFGSYSFFGDMPYLNIGISTDNNYYNKVINASINALKSRFPITVDNSRSFDLNIIVSNNERLNTASGDVLLFIENPGDISRFSGESKGTREVSYEKWGVIDPYQWVWSSKTVSLDLSDIKFSKLVLPRSTYDRVILVSEDDKPILSVRKEGNNRIYFCSISISSEFSNLIMGGGIVKIIAIVINDIIGLSECETDFYKEDLALISSPFNSDSYTGLVPGLYRRSDGKVVGVNVREKEFDRLNIDSLKNRMSGKNTNFFDNLDDYIGKIKSRCFDLRPLLLIFVFALLLLDSIIFYPAFHRLAAGAVL